MYNNLQWKPFLPAVMNLWRRDLHGQWNQKPHPILLMTLYASLIIRRIRKSTIPNIIALACEADSHMKLLKKL